MSKTFGAARMLLNLATWAAETTTPNAGAGTVANIGSFWQRQGAYPATPTETYLKIQPQDTGWLKQNTINLNVFNVADPQFGAVGDGVTDDTAAIQAATDAAQAAGGGIVYFPPVNVGAGKFYRLKRVVGQIWSITLDNYHNITFMGDGFASKVELFDDQTGTTWEAFRINNGSTHISFNNFQLSGEGVTNSGAANPITALIIFIGKTTDANSGLSFCDVSGMYWGDIATTSVTTGQGTVCVFEYSEDQAHVVTNISHRYNMFNAACAVCLQIGSGFSSGFSNKISVEYNACAKAVFQQLVLGLDPANTGNDYVFMGNIANGTTGLTSGTLETAKRGLNTWNIVTAGGGIRGTTSVSGDNQCRNSVIRGNVVTTTIDGVGGRGIHCAPSGVNMSVIGNVVDRSFDSSQQMILASVAPGFMATDNIVSTLAAAAVPAAISLSTAAGLVANGNIAIFTANAVNLGVGVQFTGATTTDLVNAVGVGNLIVASGANRVGVGVQFQVQNAFDMHNVMASMNLVANPNSGVVLAKGTGAFSDYRGVNDNNCVNVGTVVVTLSVLTTIEGPAGPGAQAVLFNATPVATVAATVGSLAANTTGGQATALWYKETGTGVSGGTALWLGIGGYDLTMGTLAATTTTTALFLAPGSLGLATAGATEIQFAVPRPGTMRNLRQRCTVGTGGGTATYTVRKNGVDTTLLAAITNTASNGADTTHSFTVAKADLISIKITKTGTITTGQTNVVATIELV